MREKFFHMYPGTKFLLLTFLSVSTFLIPTHYYGFGCFLFYILLSFLCGVAPSYLKSVRSSLVILAVFMFVMKTIFTKGSTPLFTVGSWPITMEGVDAGLLTASRMLCLAGGILLFFKLTSARDLTAWLENLKLRPGAVYVVLASMQMIDEMKKQSTIIMDAQQARGVEVKGGLASRFKAFAPLLGPLLFSAIANADERVLTLESRGFSSTFPKNRLYQLNKKPVDTVIAYSVIGLLLLMAGGRWFL